jgi:hypothetical protein
MTGGIEAYPAGEISAWLVKPLNGCSWSSHYYVGYAAKVETLSFKGLRWRLSSLFEAPLKFNCYRSAQGHCQSGSQSCR